jgi:hypothetical protein
MMMHIRWLSVLLLLQLATPVLAADNTLSDDEKQAGWSLLFDGKTTEGWRGYKMKEMPPGWKVIDGALVRVSGGAGGKGAGGGDDIITIEQFANFELQLDWKIVDKAGNSGVVLRASEDAATSWHTGPEVQLLDNAAYPGRSVKQMAGACYDLYAPAKDVSRPIGQWNTLRIIANGPHIEHWLNGTKLLEYELGSDEWKQLVAKSKFKDMKHFKTPPTKGHICLQDHTARLEFRNVKIRPLPDTVEPVGTRKDGRYLVRTFQLKPGDVFRTERGGTIKLSGIDQEHITLDRTYPGWKIPAQPARHSIGNWEYINILSIDRDANSLKLELQSATKKYLWEALSF